MHITYPPRQVEAHLQDLFNQLNHEELLQLYRKGLEVTWDSKTGTAQISHEGSPDALALAWGGGFAAQTSGLQFTVKVEQHPQHPRVPLRLEHLPEQWRQDCGDLNDALIADPDWLPEVDWIRSKAATLHHACAWRWLEALYVDTI